MNLTIEKNQPRLADGKSAQRNPAMDIVRCFALLFVVSVHFFLNSGFYNEPVLGVRMYIMTLMRSFFMICVPLFILLTGYLNCNKKICKSHYSKLIYTIVIYLLASACCLTYKIVWVDKEFSVYKIIEGFFEYRNARYSWYVEMYIGLFLLCPFLNVLYHNLKDKKQKKGLILTLLLLTAIPSITNIFCPSLNWFLDPTSKKDYWEILPNWWKMTYPITYYFIGCYLRQYKLNISCTRIAILSVLLFLINGTFNYYRSYDATFVWATWGNYESILVTAQAVLFFAFFDNLRYEKFPRFGAAILKKISGLCFGAYLLSEIFDDLAYTRLVESIPWMGNRLNFFPLVVPGVYLCSLALSYLLNLIYDFGAWCCRKISRK